MVLTQSFALKILNFIVVPSDNDAINEFLQINMAIFIYLALSRRGILTPAELSLWRHMAV